MKQKSTLRILMADDDETDRELFTEAINSICPDCHIDQVKNGLEALGYLKQTRALPDLIFLDLNMPVMGGREALSEIKQSDKLKVIPVFILSTSSSQSDVFESYASGANLFLVKPSSYDRLVQMLRNLIDLFDTNLVTAAAY
jgi:two-component system, chemotaxis family, response regulator Rcp1